MTQNHQYLLTKNGAIANRYMAGDRFHLYHANISEFGKYPQKEIDTFDFAVKDLEPWENTTDNPPDDYGQDAFVVTPKKIKAQVIYCDSVSWDASVLMTTRYETDAVKECFASRDDSGDGTKENPFRNVCRALEHIICMGEKISCRSCMPPILLEVSGVVDYPISCYTLNTGDYRFYLTNLFGVIIRGMNTVINADMSDWDTTTVWGGRLEHLTLQDCTFTFNITNSDRISAIEPDNDAKAINCQLDLTANVTDESVDAVYGFDVDYAYKCTVKLKANHQGSTSCYSGGNVYECVSEVSDRAKHNILADRIFKCDVPGVVWADLSYQCNADRFTSGICVRCESETEYSEYTDDSETPFDVKYAYFCTGKVTNDFDAGDFYATPSLCVFSCDIAYSCNAEARCRMTSATKDWDTDCHPLAYGFTGGKFYNCTATVHAEHNINGSFDSVYNCAFIMARVAAFRNCDECYNCSGVITASGNAGYFGCVFSDVDIVAASEQKSICYAPAACDITVDGEKVNWCDYHSDEFCEYI